jgi:hypothetical protein
MGGNMIEHDCQHPGFLPIKAIIPGVTGNAVLVSVQMGTVSTQKGVTIAVQQGEF